MKTKSTFNLFLYSFILIFATLAFTSYSQELLYFGAFAVIALLKLKQKEQEKLEDDL